MTARSAQPPAASASVRRAPFVAAIGLSAFLLFSLELLAGRLVLPVFGGTPGVWATTLCFFTAILFIGYGYAHLVASRLTPRQGGSAQLVVAVGATILTLVAPGDVASLRVAGLPEALDVLLAVAVIAGAAGFVLASTTPLLSSWYADRGGEPWWLYAVSNGASFAALLAYPFLIQPFIGLSVQRLLVVGGLIAYVGLLAVIVRGNRTETLGEADPAPPPASERLGRRRVALWLVAAMVPAGLLAATTNFLQTDLVAAPFIWIGPLGIYLSSFVVAFSGRGVRIVQGAQRLVPAAATVMWMPFIHPTNWPPIAIVPVELGTLFVLATAIHGRLYADRPAPGRLTIFYLVLSAGGVLATAFVALVAPVIFDDIFEYPILIVAGVVVLALLDGRHAPWLPARTGSLAAPARAFAWRVVPYLVMSAVLYVLVSGNAQSAAEFGVPFAAGVLAVAIALTPRMAAIATPLAIVLAGVLNVTGPQLSLERTRVRDFFGVIHVVQSDDLMAELSGTTLHGVQFTDTKRLTPTTYYVQSGPLGGVFDDLRARTSGAAIGVVGLGVGTISAYERNGDTLTFYEIDPNAVKLAFDTRYFSFLLSAPVAPRIVPGDGRLSLAAAPPASYDLLVLDAFSSDAVPPHLLTQQAMETYMRTLRPGGILLFNVSNRYYELGNAVGATARSIGLDVAGKTYAPDATIVKEQAATSSSWVVVGRAADVARFVPLGWVRITSGGTVLTDDNPDLTRELRLLSR